MIDNFLKIICLTPDILYDTTIGDIGPEGIYQVFKEYEKLENLSVGNLLQNNGRISFLEVPNQLFDYITSKLVVEQGQLKLATHMHIFRDERKIVLCLPYGNFQNIIRAFKEVLINKQSELIRNLNTIGEELESIVKFDKIVNSVGELDKKD